MNSPMTIQPPTTAVEPHVLPFSTTQEWDGYTEEDHEVWHDLFDRRMRELGSTGSEIYLSGADLIGLRPERVPDLSEVNARLAPRTGWRAIPVIGFIPAPDFFACLARRWFPTTVIMRTREQMEYLPEPDIFHDVFGHVPLHADPVFADFLEAFGRTACLARGEEETQAMARLFWFTVEFGLVRERGEVRVYGSGLISSAGDAANALGSRCERKRFELDAVMEQPFEIDRFQDVLFVIDSFDELFEGVEEAERRLRS